VVISPESEGRRVARSSRLNYGIVFSISFAVFVAEILFLSGAI